MTLDNTAASTETHFDYAGRLRELDVAVLLARKSLELHAAPDPLHSESLDKLADALSTRFEDGGHVGDLDEAVSLYRQALELRPTPIPLRADSLNNLSKVLLMRFKQGGQLSDLGEAISLSKQVLELQPLTPSLRSTSLHNLALALYRQFLENGQKNGLNESISLYRQALKLQTTSHPLRPTSSSDLANALCERFRREGRQSDLDEGILLHKQALELRPAPHPHRSASLSNLGIALYTQFEQKGHQSDLDEAILLHRQSLELRPSPHPLRSLSLNNLAIAFWIRFEDTGQRRDLDEAISLHRQALDLQVLPLHQRSLSLSNLAGALRLRFEQSGHQSDLDEAITVNRQALELRPSPHPLRPFSINNLALGLVVRFQQGGHNGDLDEAILLYRQDLGLLPLLSFYRSLVLDNLATALWTKFEKEGHQIHLNEAIALHREALPLIPDHLRPECLNNLANTLQTRFQQEGHQTDLDEAISLHREALDLRNLSSPFRSQSLNNLANALRTRFEHAKRPLDLNDAISLYRQALELRNAAHPDQSRSLYELGIGLMHAHSLAGKNSAYLDEAMELFCTATHCLNQPASLRLRIAHTWIKHAILHQHVSAIDAYDAALQGLPKLAALSFDVKSRQQALVTDSDGLARDASIFAIQAGKLDKAIEFLEAGRAVFWSQFLSLRSPLEQLREISPELADKLRETATGLEIGSHRNTLAEASENRQKLIIDQETARLNRLNEEWSKAIDDVRQLNGFEDFLRPRSLSELQVAASKGPAIILLGNDNGSDILILTSIDVRTIHVSGLPTQELQTLVHFIRFASLGSSRANIKDHSEKLAEFSPTMVETLRNWTKLKEARGMRYDGQKDSDTVFKFVLDTLWNEVVRPVINILRLEKSEEPPVVQWCPTGLFSFLPIHAAGCYDDDLCIESASDYFISSYTPTIGALLTQYQTPSPTKSFRMLVVIQSQELPSTRKELENIEQHVSDDLLVKLGIPGQSASVEEVASRLSDMDIVHFSCHGTQDRSNPLDSGLKLEDGYLRVSRIMKEKIPNGALVFLCACETAMGDGKLPDEAMSLGASLLFAGFRRVVATMWEIQDRDGPVVADAFYKELIRGPDGRPTREPDASKSAYALHMAVKTLRNEKASFSRWVPFIHMGN
ncbi:hypothetical protein GALMADRAFT_1352198 [Galerina marginata CBS 339.88]|uniref:CHAT domain-containing protein n=1 Tax=Galerina marginata (strain CBS 339.88) TaxID=685588 RepID=A0A067SPJ0_GALM3|nr:hypothetical protein GALMADRAFT_1352198 [Galerina marginata CBS 339.88]